MKRFMLLGAGELAKEFVIATQRYGFVCIAVDKYHGAPAMQVATYSKVINMFDANALQAVVDEFKPNYIVPEIEAIRVEKLIDFENQGYHVVPCANAVNITMNRKKTRDLAVSLGFPTAKHAYAYTLDELTSACETIGYPCLVKPFMSSSGKGQTCVRNAGDISNACEKAITHSRGDTPGVIVEEFIPFTSEITLLTVTSENKTKFCAPVGHNQVNGDYQESWQPHYQITDDQYQKAKHMADTITRTLGGSGIWGVEFFLCADGGVLFNELSPRPHDTGFVTMVTQWHNQFQLHLHAILGWETNTHIRNTGASHAVCSDIATTSPEYHGIPDALQIRGTHIHIFGKPSAYIGRRMGLALAAIDGSTFRDICTVCERDRSSDENTSLELLITMQNLVRENVVSAAKMIKIKTSQPL